MAIELSMRPKVRGFASSPPGCNRGTRWTRYLFRRYDFEYGADCGCETISFEDGDHATDRAPWPVSHT